MIPIHGQNIYILLSAIRVPRKETGRPVIEIYAQNTKNSLSVHYLHLYA